MTKENGSGILITRIKRKLGLDENATNQEILSEINEILNDAKQRKKIKMMCDQCQRITRHYHTETDTDVFSCRKCGTESQETK